MIGLQTIAVAFAMFSALPVPQFAWNQKNMRYAMCAFPLIGVVIGGLWCLCGALPLPMPAKAAGFCLIPVWVTGGIHLDGYADTCDALSSYGDTAKKLEILKDPHCGAFRWLSSPGVALSMTLCIYVTHLIYAFVLLPTAHRRDDESWLKGRFSFGNVCVHFITPGLTVLQWLLWQDKAGLTVGHAVWWLVLPLAYFAFAMLRAGTGKPIGRTGQLYPYPFLDYPRLGAGRFWLYATAILTFFFGLGCLFVGIGHLLA